MRHTRWPKACPRATAGLSPQISWITAAASAARSRSVRFSVGPALFPTPRGSIQAVVYPAAASLTARSLKSSARPSEARDHNHDWTVAINVKLDGVVVSLRNARYWHDRPP